MFKTNSFRFGAAIAMAVALACSASAVTTVHNTVADFLNSTQPGFYLESFATVPNGPSGALNFGPVNGFSYTVNTAPGSISGLFNDGGRISTDNASDKLRVTFTGAPVTAVGGNMWGTDIGFNAIPSNVVIALSDGTIESYNASADTAFRGFTTTGPAIAWIDIDAVSDAIIRWPTLDNLYVGTAVPEPTSALASLMGMLVLGLLRRR